MAAVAMTRRVWWRRLFGAGAVVVAVIAGITGARADFQNGNLLYDVCTKTGNSADGVCMGYVAGIADVMVHQAVEGYTACFPEHATQGQTQDIAKRFLGAHPELRHYAAISLVAQALAEAFPCPK